MLSQTNPLMAALIFHAPLLWLPGIGSPLSFESLNIESARRSLTMLSSAPLSLLSTTRNSDLLTSDTEEGENRGVVYLNH